MLCPRRLFGRGRALPRLLWSDRGRSSDTRRARGGITRGGLLCPRLRHAAQAPARGLQVFALGPRTRRRPFLASSSTSLATRRGMRGRGRWTTRATSECENAKNKIGNLSSNWICTPVSSEPRPPLRGPRALLVPGPPQACCHLSPCRRLCRSNGRSRFLRAS